MAIDRIGKGAGLPSTSEVSGVSGPSHAAKTDAVFKVERPLATSHATHVDGAAGLTSLERFQAGEVDVNGFVDLEVDKATSALKGLHSSELDEIRSLLRDQMRSDPGLQDLVRAATGAAPTPPED